MNLIILFENDFIEGTRQVRIQDHRLEHILAVNRPSVGDELRVGLVGWEHWITAELHVLKKMTVIEMDVVLDREPPAPLQLTLILAMVRPRVFRRVLTQVTAIGIKKIIVINSYRVEKSFWKSPVLKADSLNKHIILGLEQGQDTIVPEVLIRPLFKPFVEDELPDIIKGTLSICCSSALSNTVSLQYR